MNTTKLILMTIPWLIWLAYWLAVSKKSKTTVKQETPLSRSIQNGTVAMGALLILIPGLPTPALTLNFKEFDSNTMTGSIINIAGLLFTVWARVHLGRNWSAAVTLKQDHELVRSGPYAWVRHPIYTGCLFALFGCTLINGQLHGAVGFLIISLALAYKVKLEESMLTTCFGDEYARYRERVRALIPGIY